MNQWTDEPTLDKRAAGFIRTYDLPLMHHNEIYGDNVQEVAELVKELLAEVESLRLALKLCQDADEVGQ